MSGQVFENHQVRSEFESLVIRNLREYPFCDAVRGDAMGQRVSIRGVKDCIELVER